MGRGGKRRGKKRPSTDGGERRGCGGNTEGSTRGRTRGRKGEAWGWTGGEPYELFRNEGQELYKKTWGGQICFATLEGGKGMTRCNSWGGDERLKRRAIAKVLEDWGRAVKKQSTSLQTDRPSGKAQKGGAEGERLPWRKRVR